MRNDVVGLRCYLSGPLIEYGRLNLSRGLMRILDRRAKLSSYLPSPSPCPILLITVYRKCYSPRPSQILTQMMRV